MEWSSDNLPREDDGAAELAAAVIGIVVFGILFWAVWGFGIVLP